MSCFLFYCLLLFVSCSRSITSVNYVVSVRMGFTFLLVLGIGYAISL